MVIPSGHEDGSLRFYQADNNAKRVQVLKSEPIHKRAVTDLKMTDDKLFCLSASKDFTVKLSTSDTLETVKTLTTDRPVNAAAISSLRNHVILGNRCVA